MSARRGGLKAPRYFTLPVQHCDLRLVTSSLCLPPLHTITSDFCSEGRFEEFSPQLGMKDGGGTPGASPDE